MTPGDPILLAIILALDAVLGRPALASRLWTMRVPGLDGLVRGALRRLDRPHRTAGDRHRRGMVTAILLGLLGAGAGLLLARMAHNLPVTVLVEGWVLLWTLGQRGTVTALRTVADGMDAADGHPGPVRKALARLGVDAAAIDDRHGLARACIEAAAAQTAAALCAPVLAWLLFGLPGLGVLLVLRAGMDAVRDERAVPAASAAFATGYARVLDAALWLPGLLAGLLLAAGAAFAPGARPDRALYALLLPARGAQGRVIPIAAVAAAYDMALIGPRSAGPVLLPEGRWVGGGTARLEAGHVRRAAALFTLAALLQFMLLLVLIAVER